MFPRNSGYKYSPARIHIFKMMGKGLDDGLEHDRRWATRQGALRDMYIDEEAEYKAGEYIVVAEVDWIEATQDKSFALTCYSE